MPDPILPIFVKVLCAPQPGAFSGERLIKIGAEDYMVPAHECEDGGFNAITSAADQQDDRVRVVFYDVMQELHRVWVPVDRVRRQTVTVTWEPWEGLEEENANA